MKIKHLLTKTLLVAAGLCLGAGNVWAGVTTLVNIDYSTTTTPAWKVVGGTGTITDGKWVHAQGGGGGNRSAYLDFGVASSIDDNWTVEFDLALKPGSDRNDQQVAVTGANTTYANNTSATGYMYFAVKEEANGGTAYTVKIGNADVATGVTLENGTTYHIIVTYDGLSAVTAKIGDTQYNGTVAIANVGKLRGLHSCVARYNGAATFDNILVTKEVTVEEVSTPSIAVAYAGANRTVTITPGESSESNAVTTYYTLDGEDPTSSSSVYSTPLDIAADCTVKAITISSTSVASAIASQSVTVGTLKLATPTFTKTGYANGSYTVSMSSNQTGLAYPPASTTLYYSIDGGSATEYSSPLSVTAGSTVTGYVTATNYTNSDEAVSTTAVRPVLSEVWSIDFSGQATEDKGTVTVGETAFSANGVDFGNISGSFTSNANFGVKTGSSWLLRNGSRGLYSFNTSATPVGVSGLTTGQYIKMVVSDMDTRSASDAASLVEDMSTTTELYIVANEDGNANINFNRYAYIKSIAVCNVVTSIPVEIKSSGSTFSSAYAIDCDALPTGVKAYKVTKMTASEVTASEVTGKVAANTGLILKADEDKSYDIPVVASGVAVEDNKLKAAVTATPVAADEAYGLKDGKFHKLKAGTISAGKAYLLAADITSAPDAPELTIVFGGEATGIADVRGKMEDVRSEIYNLNGQRVAQPAKGLYIQNGRKVILK